MSLIQGIVARLRSLFRARWVERRMDEEFQFHIEMETRENIRRGLEPSEARRRALVAFGGVDPHREAIREGRGLALVREVLQDARLGLRMFRREPTFTISVVLTLALTIGATTAVFTLVRRAVLEPLPFPGAGELVSLATRYAGWGIAYGSLSQPEVSDLGAMRETFSQVAAFRLRPVDLGREGGLPAERLRGLHASATFLSALRVTPMLGRALLPDEDLPGGAGVVVLTHGLWRRLGGDSGLVGRELALNSEPHTVIGVLPPGFEFEQADVVLPLRLDPASPTARGAHYLRSIGRLAAGVSTAQAAAALGLTSARLRADFPENYPDDLGWSLVLQPLHEAVLGDAGDTLRMLGGAVVLVLLIACVNVTNLLLARMHRRERELSLRSALGAGRARLARQLVTESLVLALAGAAIGVLISTVGANALLRLSPGAIPRVDRLGFDVGMLITAIALAGGSTILFALAPALRAAREVAPASLVSGTRGASAGGWGAGGRGIMATLVSVEVGLAVLVVISAGLLLRSYVRLSRVDLGFTPANVLALDIALPQHAYGSPPEVTHFVQRFLERLDQLPGVERVGAIRGLPLRSGTGSIDIMLESRPAEPGQSDPSPNFQVVTPGYFETMRIPLVRGRFPAVTDDVGAPVVAWVNQAAAARLWPGQDAVGQRFRFSGDTGSVWFTVAGVVGDVRNVGAAAAPAWEYYLLHAQLPGVLSAGEFHRALSVVVRTTGGPETLAQPVRRVLADLDSRVAPARVAAMTTVVSRAIGRPRLAATLVGSFAMLAGVLATVGIYGVLSYAVIRRTREIGIRMALGARSTRVVGTIASQGLKAAGIGILVGTLGALFTGRLLTSLLFGIGPRDPMVFAVSILGLTAVALAAAMIPARRAARVSPAETLRAE